MFFQSTTEFQQPFLKVHNVNYFKGFFPKKQSMCFSTSYQYTFQYAPPSFNYMALWAKALSPATLIKNTSLFLSKPTLIWPIKPYIYIFKICRITKKTLWVWPDGCGQSNPATAQARVTLGRVTGGMHMLSPPLPSNHSKPEAAVQMQAAMATGSSTPEATIQMAETVDQDYSRRSDWPDKWTFFGPIFPSLA